MRHVQFRCSLWLAIAFLPGLSAMASTPSQPSKTARAKTIRPNIPQLSLPPSTQANSHLKHPTSLSISKRKLYVNQTSVLTFRSGAIAAKDKHNHDAKQFLVVPLYEALKLRSSHLKKLHIAKKGPRFQGRLAMYIDSGAPFRVVSEAMYTAGLAGFTKFYFAVCASVEKRKGCQAKAHPLTTHQGDRSRSARMRQKQRRQQNKQFIQNLRKTGSLLKSLSMRPTAPVRFQLALTLTKQGVTLTLNHSDVSQGCRLSSKALNAAKKRLPTFPRDAKSNKLPLKQLKACLTKIKKLHPKQLQLTLQADHKRPHREVIQMLDVSRSAFKGKALFPQVIVKLKLTH